MSLMAWEVQCPLWDAEQKNLEEVIGAWCACKCVLVSCQVTHIIQTQVEFGIQNTQSCMLITATSHHHKKQHPFKSNKI